MASIQEQLDKAKDSTKYWNKREEPQIKATQHAKRLWEADRNMRTARAWHKEQRQLARIRDHITRAEHNLLVVENRYHHMTKLEKQDSYWRDRVQDLKRERHRICLLLGQMRMVDMDEKLSA